MMLLRMTALALGLGFIVPGFSQQFAPPPFRLQAKMARTTMAHGVRGTLIVSFLDRNYGPTSNDMRRTIELQPQPAGIVNMPQRLDALPGQKEFPVSFVGLRSGRALIRVVSKGLEPASALLIIADTKSSTGSLLPQAWAADTPDAEIVIADPRPFPANGKSLSPFFLQLERASRSATQVRIDSNPRCVLLYPGGPNSRPASGSLIITIPPGEQSSQTVQVRTAQPGDVTLSARALPSGKTSQATLTFEEPRAVSLAFDDSRMSIPVGAQNVPLHLQIADQDNIALARLRGTWSVSLRSSVPGDAIHLDPDRLVLSPQKSERDVFLSVGQSLSSEDLWVFATAEGNPLRRAEKRLGFQSSVGAIKVLAPHEVNRNVPIQVTALFRGVNGNQEAATEFPRTVTFYSDQGKFDPESFHVKKDETAAQSMFIARQAGQRPEITISTRGVDPVTIQLLVVTPLGILVLFALCAGVIGGLARFFYYSGQSWDILPKRSGRGWNPGFVGNAAFCGVFGVVTLLMMAFSLVHPFDPEHRLALTNVLVHTSPGAFLLGIAGGFAGVGVLEMLASQLGLADALERRAKRVPQKAAAAGQAA